MESVPVVVWKGSSAEKKRKRKPKKEGDPDILEADSESADEGDGEDSHASSPRSSSSDHDGSDGGDDDDDDGVVLGAGGLDSEDDGEPDDVSDGGSSVANLSDEYQSVSSVLSTSILASDVDLGSDGDVADPPADAAGEARARGPRRRQEGLDVYDGDRLVQPDGLKFNATMDNFYAKCCNPAHGNRCFLTRSAHAGPRPCQGRPLGFLAAWVIDSFNPLYATASDHSRLCRPSRNDRRRARRYLGLRGDQVALAHDFCAKERPKDDAESQSEPEVCP